MMALTNRTRLGNRRQQIKEVRRENQTKTSDMQKVEILPPADSQVKISAKGQNQATLLGFMNFRQFSDNFC